GIRHWWLLHGSLSLASTPRLVVSWPGLTRPPTACGAACGKVVGHPRIKSGGARPGDDTLVRTASNGRLTPTPRHGAAGPNSRRRRRSAPRPPPATTPATPTLAPLR